MPKAKRLIWDLEVLPYEGWFWDTGKQYVSHRNVTGVKTICSAAWKWWGKKKAHCISALDHPDGFSVETVRDDGHIIKALHEVLSEADILIGHNIRRFDMKQFNARALDHGLGPISPKLFVDTLQASKSNFSYPSHSLNYLGERYGIGSKLDTPDKWWLGVMEGNKGVMRDVTRYNKQDVILNDGVYTKMLPYIHNHPNINAIEDGVDPKCGKCGSGDLHWKNQYFHTPAAKKRVYYCMACHTHGNSPVNILKQRPVTR
jgi:hypothetical protein